MTGVSETAPDLASLRLVMSELERLVAANPLDANALAAVDAVLLQSRDPLSVVPLESSITASRAALHARALHAAGRLQAAVELLIDLADFDTEAPYVAFADAWSIEASAFDETCRLRCEEKLVRLLAGRVAHSNAQRTLESAARLLARIGAGDAWSVAATAARRMGHPDLAHEIAHCAYERTQTAPAAAHVALALRDRGDDAGALQWFARARQIAPEDAALALDLADTLLDSGHFSEARSLYSRYREQAPDWAESSILACAWLERGERAALAELWKRAESGDVRARELGNTPFVRWLPVPCDPASQAVRQTIERLQESGANPWHARWAGERALEPSLQLALSVAAAASGVTLELELPAEASAPAEPSVPEASVSPWVFTGSAASTPFAAPPPDVCDELAALAASYFDLRSWAVAARALGRRWGPAGAEALLASFVHIPIPNELPDPLDWTQRVQIVAALALSGVDDGWHGSLRRALLSGLIAARWDWVTSAAALALTVLALEDASLRSEVLDLLACAQRAVPAQTWPDFALTVLRLALIPDAESVRRELWLAQRRWLRERR